ncbi:hypothetical protein [Pseudomonas baetica]|uniref:hypothetical protein n=1 Tax=Pseudomonas baetica TaxID=674054 RepID=UPI002405755F|nr:hypothetical protein [Pseudomonas baetica]MDF9779245.1 hypothetical protein [Pseudomonas baetica]
MSNVRYAIALIIITVSPFLAASLNDGVTPAWMDGLAIAGLVLGAIVAFLPTRKDVG